MKLENLGIMSVAGIIIGILGVIGPIAWDYYKTKSEVELRVIERSVIISKPKKLEGLLITYRGEALEELSKTAFSFINTGRTPILKKDIAMPISIQFSKESNVLDAKIEELYPKDLGASIQFNREPPSIMLEFPLLNPGDRIDFSILARKDNIDFSAGGRIAGVSSLKIEKDNYLEKKSKNRPWTIYPVGLFSLVLAFASFVGFSQYPRELKFKRAVKRGTFKLPNIMTRDEFISWVESSFDFTTDSEREPLLVLSRELPDTDNFSVDNNEKIMACIKNTLDNATSNLWMGIFVLTISAIGGVYVFTNL